MTDFFFFYWAELFSKLYHLNFEQVLLLLLGFMSSYLKRRKCYTWYLIQFFIRESGDIYRQSLIFSSITKNIFLANFHANKDIFIIHRQSVTISVTVFYILTKNDQLSFYLTSNINKIVSWKYKSVFLTSNKCS